MVYFSDWKEFDGIEVFYKTFLKEEEEEEVDWIYNFTDIKMNNLPVNGFQSWEKLIKD